MFQIHSKKLKNDTLTPYKMVSSLHEGFNVISKELIGTSFFGMYLVNEKGNVVAEIDIESGFTMVDNN